MTNEEIIEQTIEWLDNASYNCDNVLRAGIGLVPIIKSQIENSIKNLKEINNV